DFLERIPVTRVGYDLKVGSSSQRAFESLVTAIFLRNDQMHAFDGKVRDFCQVKGLDSVPKLAWERESENLVGLQRASRKHPGSNLAVLHRFEPGQIGVAVDDGIPEYGDSSFECARGDRLCCQGRPQSEANNGDLCHSGDFTQFLVGSLDIAQPVVYPPFRAV